jgi:hypothetical protein
VLVTITALVAFALVLLADHRAAMASVMSVVFAVFWYSDHSSTAAWAASQAHHQGHRTRTRMGRRVVNPAPHSRRHPWDCPRPACRWSGQAHVQIAGGTRFVTDALPVSRGSEAGLRDLLADEDG